MRLRQEPVQELRKDFSNLAEIDLIELKKALADPTTHEVILKRLNEEMVRIGESGNGVELNEITVPIKQEKGECQTWTIVNGILARGGHAKLGTTSEQRRTFVHQVREYVKNLDHQGMTGVTHYDGTHLNADAEFSMLTIADALQKFGISIRRLSADHNPILLVRELFKEKRFLGVAKDESWHATTIVPLANADLEQFVVELDSYTASKKILSLQEFLELILDRKVADRFEIFEINS